MKVEVSEFEKKWLRYRTWVRKHGDSAKNYVLQKQDNTKGDEKNE